MQGDELRMISPVVVFDLADDAEATIDPTIVFASIDTMLFCDGKDTLHVLQRCACNSE